MRSTLFFLIGMLWISDTVLHAQKNVHNESLSKYIEFRTTHDRYSGVTAIYEDDSLIFSSIAGMADKSFQIKNNFDTKFNLASGTKMFTAVATMILVEQQVLDLNRPFMYYFPSFPLQEANKITIRQLLSHTSGFSDLFFLDAYLHFDRTRLRILKDYDQFFDDLTIAEVEHEQMMYSNTNYLILGRVIEEVTETDFYSFMEDAVFEPLHMQSTGFFEKDEVVKNKAHGYFNDTQASAEFGVPNDDQVRSNNALLAIKGMPAGGAYSTVSDMQKFIYGLKNDRLLSNETFTEMIRFDVDGYGLGFQSYEINNTRVWGHSGGFYGVSTMVFHLPERDITFICLTNQDFAAQPVFDYYLQLLEGTEPVSPIHMNTEALNRFEGYYMVEEGDMRGSQIEISAREGRLLFDQALEFYPVGKHRFFDIDNPTFFMTFKLNGDSVVGFNRTDNGQYKQIAVKIPDSKVQEYVVLDLPLDKMEEYLVDFQFTDEGMMPGHKPAFTIKDNALVVDNMMRFIPFELDKFFLEGDPSMQLHFLRNSQEIINKIHVIRGEQVVGVLLPLSEN